MYKGKKEQKIEQSYSGKLEMKYDHEEYIYSEEETQITDETSSEESEINFEDYKYKSENQLKEEKEETQESHSKKKKVLTIFDSNQKNFSVFDNSIKLAGAISKNAKKNRLDFKLGIEGFAKCLNDFSCHQFSFREGDIIQVISVEESLGRVFASDKVFHFDKAMVEFLENSPETNIPENWFFKFFYIYYLLLLFINLFLFVFFYLIFFIFIIFFFYI